MFGLGKTTITRTVRKPRGGYAG